MKLSAVVQLIDGFRLAPAAGIHPAFLLNAKPYRPLTKPDGFYAFSALDDGNYRLTTMALPFFTQDVEFKVPLRVPLAEGIVPCVLEPSPLYPYPPGTTLVRGQVRAAKTHHPLAGVSVEARYRNVRGEPRSTTTQTSDYGHYDGRYALAPRGKLTAQTQVTLIFSKAGYTSAEAQLTLDPATTQFVDIEMH
jgi:hypothetical protein